MIKVIGQYFIQPVHELGIEADFAASVQPEGQTGDPHLSECKKAVPAVESADEEFLKKLNTKNRERFIECLIELNPNMS